MDLLVQSPLLLPFLLAQSQSTSKDPAGDPTETSMDVGLLDGRPAEAAGDGSPLALWCGRLTGFVLFILATCVVVLEPNQYGILAAKKVLKPQEIGHTPYKYTYR